MENVAGHRCGDKWFTACVYIQKNGDAQEKENSFYSSEGLRVSNCYGRRIHPVCQWTKCLSNNFCRQLGTSNEGFGYFELISLWEDKS
jgi:hypothetical protein